MVKLFKMYPYSIDLVKCLKISFTHFERGNFLLIFLLNNLRNILPTYTVAMVEH